MPRQWFIETLARAHGGAGRVFCRVRDWLLAAGRIYGQGCGGFFVGLIESAIYSDDRAWYGRMMSRFKKIVLAFAGILIAAVIVFMAATWAPDRPVESLKARWASPPSTFVSVQGMSVHVRDEGPRDDPMPIILLHGTSASLHTWEGWAGALRDKHRVIRFDMAGFGLTGPHPEGRYNAEAYTSFMRAMLDQLGIRACVIAGNSFGGFVAWKTALADPRVRKLVLVDAAGYPNPNAKRPLGFKLAMTPVLNHLVAYSLPRSVIE